MKRRTMMWLVVLVVSTLASTAVQAQSLGDIKKKIEAKIQQCRTLRMEMRMNMDMGGPAGKMVADCITEFVRKDKDKWLSRTDMVTKTPRQDGKPGNEQMKMSMIYDGQFVYSIMEEDGEKMVMKMRPDRMGQKVMTEPSGFAEMEKHYELKLLPDQKVDGKNTWVIEALPKKGQASPQMDAFARMVMHYDQATGMMVKAIHYDRAGKIVGTIEVTKTTLDAKIPDERFQLPPGAQVIDMTSGMPAMPMLDDEGEE